MPRRSEVTRTNRRDFIRPDKRSTPTLLLLPVLLFLGLVLVVPLTSVLVTSFLSYDGAFMVGGFTGFDNYAEFLGGAGQAEAIWRTVRIAVATVVICLVLGYPAAHLIRGFSPRWRSVMLVGLLAPLLTSIIARSFGLVVLLGPGPVGQAIADFFGQSQTLLYTEPAIVIGMASLFLPYMVISILAGMSNIDPRLERASASLGATRLATILRVELPLAMPGVIGGIVVVTSLALSSFVTASLLGGSRNDVIATLIYRIGTTYFNKPLSAAGAVILIIMVSALIAVSLFVSQRGAARRLERI